MSLFDSKIIKSTVMILIKYGNRYNTWNLPNIRVLCVPLRISLSYSIPTTACVICVATI